MPIVRWISTIATVIGLLLSGPVAAADDSPGTIAAWKQVQRDIVKRQVTVADLDHLEALVRDDAAVSTLRGLVARRPSGDDEEAWRAIYEVFLRALPSSDVLYDHLSIGIDRMFDPDRTPGRTVYDRGGFYAWYWGPWGCAAVEAYRATGEARYLHLVTETFDQLLLVRDDQTGRIDEARNQVMPCWSDRTFGDLPTRATNVTYAGLITLPITELLLLIDEDPAAAAVVGDERARYINAIEQSLWAFEGDYREVAARYGARSAGYYHDPIRDEVEPLNHTHALGAAMVNMYVLTGERRYADRSQALLDWFLQSVTVEANGSWSWPYAPEPGNQRGDRAERFWKASITNLMPVAMYRHGIGLSREHMEHLADVLLLNVYSADADAVNTRISRRHFRPVTADEPSRRSSNLALLTWTLLDDIRPEIRDRAFEQMVKHPDRFPNAWFRGSRFGVYALAHIMANPLPDDREPSGALAAPEPVLEPSHPPRDE